MGDYKQVRSSSPSKQHRDSDELELQEQVIHEKAPNSGDEQHERLLSEDDEEDLKDYHEDDQSRKRRRRWWRLGLYGLVGLLVLTAVAVALNYFFLKETEGEGDSTFRRPSSDYIIDSAWDYDAPPTVREYHWVISDITANPDGVFRPMMVINGQFPGPMIVCNEGDTVVVNVVNEAKNATAIHWHGLFQNGTNWNDGTVGVTQCPIGPGRSYRYEFQVKDQAGSFFYHGHQAAQNLDGLAGPLIILSKEERDNQPIAYDSDRVVMVQDWYHDLSDGLLRDTLSPGSESSPTPNGALINGANKVDCSLHQNRHCDASSAILPSFDLAPNKSHRLRVINVGGFAWFEVSVDKHTDLPVTEVDGVTVEPLSDSTLLIAPGQRYSLILSANQTETSNLYWLRARMINHCFAENVLPDDGVAEAQAVIRYNSTETTSRSNGQAVLPTTENDSGKFTLICKDKAPNTYKPVPAQPAPEFADHSWYFRVNVEIGNWRLERGFVNQSTFRPQLQSPTLHRLVEGLNSVNETFDVEGVNGEAFDIKNELVVSSGGVEVVDLILQNFDEGNHPFHLHGAQMFILAAGHGYFPGYKELGLQDEGKGLLDPNNNTVIANPVRRDVTTIEAFGWTLVRFVADNPGVWLFHCHMIWHAEAGMAMQFASRLDLMRNWTIPEENMKLCEAPIDELEKGSTPKDSIWIFEYLKVTGVLVRSNEEAKQGQPTPVTMCYTTTTHFNRCSHRTSTTTFCPRSTQLRPTIYHPPTHHARPCGTNSHEDDIFVQRDGLCKACSRISFWFAGGGGGRVEDFSRRNGSRRRTDRVPTAAQMAGVPSHHHTHATQGRAVSSGPAGPTYPIPTGVPDGLCPLSEAFERAVKIGGDADDRVKGDRRAPDGMGAAAGVDGGRTRRQQGEYGPFRPPRLSSGADKVGGGLPGASLPSWPGGHGGHARRTAGRTAGRKQVRFAPKVEVLYFRRDWATRTLRSLSREYKGRR